jgi:P27 family predicted phage terminase small subunit
VRNEKNGVEKKSRKLNRRICEKEATKMRKKPTALKKIEGTYRKDRAVHHEPTPQPADSLSPPVKLDAVGQKFWDYHAPRLAKLNLLTESDTYSLAQASEWWSVHQRALADLRSGLTHTSDANGECSKPQVAIAKQAFTCMREIMKGFGLDPQSRAKISVPPPEEKDPIGDLYFKRPVAVK